MNEQENVSLARQSYQDFINGDINSILNRNTEDTEWIYPGPSDLVPFCGVFHGNEQVAQFFARLDEALDITFFEPREFVPYGDKVIIIGHSIGRARATGTVFEDDWVHIATYRNGKVSRWQNFSDTGELVVDLIRAKTQAMA